MNAIEKHLSKLGYKGKDRVTGAKGVITSVDFDLYGCIRYLVTPGPDKDGAKEQSRWFDVTRIEIKGKTPVMTQPNFDEGYVAEGKKGGQRLPVPGE